MQFLEEYIAYLKNNPEHYWFKRKPFGWGWTPVTWQGWLVTIVFIGAVILNALRLNVPVGLENEFLSPFVIETFIMLLVFIFICIKTGERPRWEWGFPKKDEENRETF